MAFNYSPKIVTDGLVLYLDAANPNSYVSGSTAWGDISRGGNNGTLVNGVGYNGANGGSLVFDGVNDYVDCNNNTSLQLTSDLTINIWMYPTKSSIGLGLVTKGPLSDDYDYMFYLTADSTLINFYKKDSNGIASFGGGFSTTLLNRWTNICFTKQGTTVKSYENSISKNSVNLANSEIRTTTNSLKIGRGFGAAYGGNIPQVQIYNRALSAQEVLQNYNATKTRFGL